MCWPAKPEQFAKWKNGQIVEPEPEKKSPNVAAGLKGDPRLKLPNLSDYASSYYLRDT